MVRTHTSPRSTSPEPSPEPFTPSLTMDPDPSPDPGPDTLEQVRANMSQAAVAASFEQLIALPKPKPAIGVVRYGQPPVLRGEWTVVASETQAVDLTAIAFDTARADGETPPR